MKIIEIGKLHVRSIPKGAAIPEGWAELTATLEWDTDANGESQITSVPIDTPPYIRSRTAQDDANDAAAKLLRFRQRAVAALNSAEQESAARDRAIVLELLTYCRHLAKQHNDLLAWLGTQTTLTGRGQLNGFVAVQPTNAEARTAIVDRINAGEADS